VAADADNVNSMKTKARRSMGSPQLAKKYGGLPYVTLACSPVTSFVPISDRLGLPGVLSELRLNHLSTAPRGAGARPVRTLDFVRGLLPLTVGLSLDGDDGSRWSAR
jgi:hypothetical protein